MLRKLIEISVMKSAGINVAKVTAAHSAGMIERAAQRKYIVNPTAVNEAAHRMTIQPAKQTARAIGAPTANMGTHIMNASGGGGESNFNSGYFKANTDKYRK